MAKDGRFSSLVRVCALLLSSILPVILALPLAAAPEENPDQAIATTLAVQIAMQQGREYMLCGKYKAAVETLEAHIARINGNRAYLLLLRDAYRSYIQELRSGKKDAEAQVYARRLELLDPPTKADQKPAAVPAKTLLVEEPAKPERVVRAVKEDDPFREENTRQRSAQNLIEEAEKEYTASRFGAALQAFEQAYKTDPSALADYQEHWAYCKLFLVVERLKAPPSAGAVNSELERDVQQAITMASTNARLVDFAKDLQGRIKERRTGSAADAGNDGSTPVRHLPRTAQGWEVAESANFRVYHTQSRETAEEVARVAERTRSDMQRKWFGELGGDWKPLGEIYLYKTAQDYSRATHESESCPGHSTINCEGAHVITRRIHLHCDETAMLGAILPHETTHVVFAGQFGEKPLPRWADEGMAVLTEPRQNIERYLTRLTDYDRQQQLFTVRELMKCDEWPETRRIPTFYAQSVSLIEFLTKEKGPQTLTRFLRDGQRGGYEKALQKYYGYKDCTELEQEWRRYALGGTTKTGVGVAEGKP